MLKILLLSAIFVPSAAMAAAPLSSHVQDAIIRVLETEHLRLEQSKYPPHFLRYDAFGMVESFQCQSMAAFNFYAFHSESAAGITVGECQKDVRLREDMAEQQARAFEAAITSALGKMDKELADTLKRQVVQDGGTIFVHLSQLFVFAQNAVRLRSPYTSGTETMLMIPTAGQTVFLVQGVLPESECKPPWRLSLCNDFRGAMREVARQMHLAQLNPPPPRIALEPLSAGRPIACDTVALMVVRALEQSAAQQTPVTETIPYKRLEGHGAEIQALMRQAAQEYSQGTEIRRAARNAGEECLRLWFKK
jgi:hypothetical protein